MAVSNVAFVMFCSLIGLFFIITVDHILRLWKRCRSRLGFGCGYNLLFAAFEGRIRGVSVSSDDVGANGSDHLSVVPTAGSKNLYSGL
jgi:hypothetical protein